MRRQLCWLLGLAIVAATSGCTQGSAAPAERGGPVPPPRQLKLEPTFERPVSDVPKPAPAAPRTESPSTPAKKSESPAPAKPDVKEKADDKSKETADRSVAGRDRGNRNGGGGMRNRGPRDPSESGQASDRPRGGFQFGPQRADGNRPGGGGPSSGESRPAAPAPGDSRPVPSTEDGGLAFGGGGFGGSGFGGGGRSGSSASKKIGFVPDGLPTWFKDLDKDGDGQIGLHEWPADRSMQEFAKYDLNGDGFITPEEVFQVEGPPKSVASNNANGTNGTGAPAAPGTPVASGPQPGQPPEGDRSRFGFGGPPGGFGDRGFGDRGGFGRDRGGFSGDRGGFGNRGMFGQQSPEERIARNKRVISTLDKNNDGKLQAEEIPQYGWWRTLRERFSEFDTNKDGAIDAEELTAFFDAQFRIGGGR